MWSVSSERTSWLHSLTAVSPSDANPIIRESAAKQLLRSKRQDRPRKAGHPDEPMRVSC